MAIAARGGPIPAAPRARVEVVNFDQPGTPRRVALVGIDASARSRRSPARLRPADGSNETLPESHLFKLKRFLAAFHEAAKLIHSLLWETERKRSNLTRRETQVLKHLAEGKTSKEIARTLGVSLKTVAAHRANIMEKLDMHDVSSLVRYAIRHGLVLP